MPGLTLAFFGVQIRKLIRYPTKLLRIFILLALCRGHRNTEADTSLL